MSEPTRVLFVTYGGGHVSMALPVAAELERRIPGGLDIKFMALTTGYNVASAARPTLGYRDFLSLVDAPAVLECGERLLAGNYSPDVPNDESIAYLGINYLDLVEQHGRRGAAEIYERSGRYAFRPLPFMRRVIEALRPDVVVATNSPRSEQAALEVARSFGIPTVGMVDLFGLQSDPFVTREDKPDWTCVIADVVRDRLVANGFSADRVVVTGNPGFDGLLSDENRESAVRLRSELGWLGRRVVLFAGHVEPVAHSATPVEPGSALPIEIEMTLRTHVRSRDDLAAIIRYHPSDWHTFPRQPEEAFVHFSEPPREAIHPLILASDVVVVQTSTVGLESAVAGKPVISIESSPAAHVWFSLAEQGVSVPCRTPQELPATLDAVLAGAVSQQNDSFRSDGRSAGRVVAVIERALG